MNNYLYQLVAKSFNLINTIQPLVLSVFEPLPESTLDWEPSTLTTEETELETTSEAEKFPNFEIVQPLEWRSPATNLQIVEEITNPLLTNLTSTPVQFSQQIPKSTPDLPQETDFQLSPGWTFPESVLNQITNDNLDNLLLTPNTELETNTTPLITASTRLSHKQLTEIDSVVSSGESPELGSGEQFLTQPLSESEMISPVINQVAFPPKSEPLKSAPIPQTKPYLSNHAVSVLLTESNTFLSNPIDLQSQPKPKSLPQQQIEINRLALSLQSPLKPDLQIYFDENLTEAVVFPFASQDKTFSQPNLNTPIFRTAIAKENNPPLSSLVVEKLGELPTQSFNNQSIEINRPVSLHTSPQVVHLKQSPTQLQAKTSTILSIPNFLQQGKFATENLHQQPREINRVFSHSQLPQVESYELFSPQLQSEPTVMSTTGNFTRGYAPAIAQMLPLTSALTSELSQKQPLQGNVSSSQVQKLIGSEILSSQILEEPAAMSTTGFANVHSPDSPEAIASIINSPLSNSHKQTLTPIIPIPNFLQQGKFATENLHQQPREINRVFSHSQLPQAESYELFSPELQSQPTVMSTTGNFTKGYAPAIAQMLPLTSALTSELSQKQPLQGNVSSSQVQKLIGSEILSSQILEEPAAMSTTGFANVHSPDSPQAIASIINSRLSNSHKQTLTPIIIATQTNVTLTHSIAEPDSKLASDMPEIPQRFIHKNISSMQPLLADTSPKLSSLQTNSSTAPLVDHLPSSVTSQPTTQLTAIHSDIRPTPTPTLHPSTAGTDIQPQVSFSDSHLSDFRGNETSAQKAGSQNHNTNYHKYINIQKTNPNESILSSPVENLILPQNASPKLSMYADRGKDGVQASYFRQLEESDLRPLSEPINDVTVKSLSVIAASSKEDQKRSSGHWETPPVIQVKIGRLEVRSTAPAPPPPRPKPRPATSLMSLNEYLRRRAGGKQ